MDSPRAEDPKTLLRELRARNRILLAQAETLRAALAEREEEIVRLTRRLRQSEGL